MGYERVLYTVISGSHAYGFPSKNSDIDVRRVVLADTDDVLRLAGSKGSIKKGKFGTTHHEPYSVGPTVIETVDYELGRFIHLLVSGNATVYEMIASPLVMYESPEMPYIKRIAREIVCRGQVRHHLGLAESELKKAGVSNESGTLIGYKVKGLLYSLRSSFAAVAVINSDEYTIDIQSLYENAKRVRPDLFDTGGPDNYVDNLISYRGDSDENAMIHPIAETREVQFVRDMLSAANSLYASDAAAWLPEKPNPYTVECLLEELVDIRRQHGRLDITG